MSNTEYLRSLYAAMDGLLTDLDANGSAEMAANSLRYHLKEHGLSIRSSEGAAPRAEGLAASPAALDVPRLADAIARVRGGGPITPEDGAIMAEAELYAVEYARLTEQEERGEPRSNAATIPIYDHTEASPAALDVEARKRLLRFIERMKAGLLIEEAVGYEDDQFVRDIEVLLWDGIAPARLTEQEER